MENFTTLQIVLIIIIPACISAIPPIISAITAKRSKAKEKAEIKESDANAADKVSSAYERVVSDLQSRLDKMEEHQKQKDIDDEALKKLWESKFEKQNKRIAHLEQGIIMLIKQVKALGAEPVFTLDNGTDKPIEEKKPNGN